MLIIFINLPYRLDTASPTHLHGHFFKKKNVWFKLASSAPRLYSIGTFTHRSHTTELSCFPKKRKASSRFI